MWQVGKQWAMARRGVLAIAVLALLVGSGLGFGLAGGSIHGRDPNKAGSVADVQAEAKKRETGGSLLLLLKRGEASRFAALETK